MNEYFIGIDASKGYSDFVMINAKKQTVIENFQLDDTFQGHTRLYELLHGFNQDYPEATIYAAVESTGGYENNWFQSLLKFRGAVAAEDQMRMAIDERRCEPAAVHRALFDRRMCGQLRLLAEPLDTAVVDRNCCRFADNSVIRQVGSHRGNTCVGE